MTVPGPPRLAAYQSRREAVTPLTATGSATGATLCCTAPRSSRAPALGGRFEASQQSALSAGLILNV